MRPLQRRETHVEIETVSLKMNIDLLYCNGSLTLTVSQISWLEASGGRNEIVLVFTADSLVETRCSYPIKLNVALRLSCYLAIPAPSTAQQR